MVQITEGWSFLAWRVSRKPTVILCKWSSPRLNSELCFGLVKDLQKNFKDGMMINLIHNCNKNYRGPCWSTALSVPRKASPEILAVEGQPALRVIRLTSWGLRLSQKRKGEAAKHGLSPLSASGLALCINQPFAGPSFPTACLWILSQLFFRAPTMAQWVKCLLPMHEDLSLDLQQPCKSWGWWGTSVTTVLGCWCRNRWLDQEA